MRTRLTWQQRFAKANAPGDGKLTLEQAQSGYPTVARSFSDIDLDAKGYVTQDDIKAWHKARRDARQQAKKWSDDPLRPRAAFQRVYPDPPQPSTTKVGTPPRSQDVPKAPAQATTPRTDTPLRSRRDQPPR